ncbi:MAG: hypothetical protein NC099_00300 [Corallococcus sp.]|nr:hypothetical protein [Corallococcus sp.]
MKSWEKRWKDELDEITPALRDDIKNTPISATENIENNGGNTAALSLNRQKMIPIFATTFAILLCVVLLCVFLIKPNKSYSDFLFTLEINPAVTMSADKNGIVTGVIASNADADIILSNENASNEIKGKSINEAVTYYTDCAARLGYIDLEQSGSAVRISGFGNEELLVKAKNSLENYFAEKGVLAVVVTESVNKDDFSLRSGISADLSVEDITEYITNGTILFTDRKAEGLNLQNLQALYNEIIVEDKLFNFVNNNLPDNVERINKNAQDMQALYELHLDILNHPDNPMKYSLGDYWTVNILYGNMLQMLSDEFAGLMTEMETALKNYKDDYGVSILSSVQLTNATDSYIKIPTDQLTALLEGFSLDKFKEYSFDIAEILEMTGVVTHDFSDCLEIPESFDEFVEKTSAVIKSEYASRIENYEKTYSKYRQPIEKSDYETYIDGIVRQYGSLNDYWNTIKN